MEARVLDRDEATLLNALDKGIDDVEAGRVTPHDEAIKIIKQRLKEHVSQSKGNGRSNQ